MKVHPDAVARAKMLTKMHNTAKTKSQKTTKKNKEKGCKKR